MLLEQAKSRVSEEGIEVILDWRMERPSTESVFTHALDCDYNLLGMSDGPPLGRMFPFWLWQPNESVRDVRRIQLSSKSLNSCCHVGIGLFDPVSVTRTTAIGPNDQPLPDNVVYLQVINNSGEYY